MAFQAGAAPRGRGSGRARGAGRGGGRGASGGGGAPPLAAQMRQLNRLSEPDEMALFRRYRDLEPLQVRSTYGPSGLLDRQIMIPPQTFIRAGANQIPQESAWISVLDADNIRSQIELGRERERALARMPQRLPGRRASWGQLTPEEKRILLLSQKEYNSFRAQREGRTQAQNAPANSANQGRPPNNDDGEDDGDDADDDGDDADADREVTRSAPQTQGGGGPQRPPPAQQRASPRK